MKRIVSLFLTIVLAMSTLVCFANAETKEDKFKKWESQFSKDFSYLLETEKFEADGDFVYAIQEYDTVKGKVTVQTPIIVGYIGDRESVTIPAKRGGKAIVLQALTSTTKIKSVKLPKNKIKVYPSYDIAGYPIYTPAFADCEYLEKITVEKGAKWCKTVGGVLCTNGGKTLKAYPISRKGKSFTIPSSVTFIDYLAFCNPKYLKNLTVPNNVKGFYDTFIVSEGLKNLYFKNNSINLKKILTTDVEGTYITNDNIIIPNATVHCFKGSNIEKFFKGKIKSKGEQNIPFLNADTVKIKNVKKIKYLAMPKAPKAVTVKSAKYTKKNGVKITVNNYKATGVKVYRLSGKKYKYIGYTHSRTFIDKTAKAGKTYKYKVRAYNKKNGIAKNSSYSVVTKIKISKKAK